MGYASRANSTAQHFATPEGVAESRAWREQHEAAQRQAAADRRRREFDALVAAVESADAAKRFGPVRLGMARDYIAKVRRG
jgi:hypothetical protein